MQGTQDIDLRTEAADPGAVAARQAAPCRDGVEIVVIDGKFYLSVPNNGHLIGPMPLRQIEDAMDSRENCK